MEDWPGILNLYLEKVKKKGAEQKEYGKNNYKRNFTI